MKATKKKMNRKVALLVIVTLLSGILSVETPVIGQSAPSALAQKTGREAQTTLKNPRILKTTQEVAPESGGQKELKNPTTEKGITTWDSIWFGNYWQEDTNGDGKADKNDEKTPIKWRVLSVDGDDVFLLADKNMDCQKYNDTETDVTWETCTMRSWLNGYGAEVNVSGKDYRDNNFLNDAFTAGEQSAIKTVNVVNDDNSEYNTEGGNNTLDKVYLLSVDEVKNPAYGFMSDDSSAGTRSAVNTAYVVGEMKISYMGSAGDWWLRSPGYSSNYASDVGSNGYVIRRGNNVDYDGEAVRPVLHLNLKALNWSYAGSVTSDDVAEWDCIWFGNYWQEDTNGDGRADKQDEKTPVKWRVLSVEGDDVFLLADQNLDCQKYNDTETDVTWETCTIRSWLNGYRAEVNVSGKDYRDNNFLNDAFTTGEQSAIKTVNVVNSNDPVYGTEGGNDTLDKVYLLSVDEAKNPAYGFMSDDGLTGMRSAVNTDYVVREIESSTNVTGSISHWWLRSGTCSSIAPAVYDAGNVFRNGYNVDHGFVSTRPVLHLDLKASPDAVSASHWSYAGTVISEGIGEGEAPSQPAVPGSTQIPGTSVAPGTAIQPTVKVDIKPTAISVVGSVGRVDSVKLKQKKQTVTASWKKVSGASGYQVCYSTSKKWKGRKQKLTRKTKLTIKKLKKNKTYYFRVRAYRMNGTEKVYGEWSKTGKIKIKK